MGRQPIAPEVVEVGWAIYLRRQSPSYVSAELAAAGHVVSTRTVRRWIADGDLKRGIKSFRERFENLGQDMRQQLARQPVAFAQVEADQAVVEVAADALREWRQDLSGWLARQRRLGELFDHVVDSVESQPDLVELGRLSTIVLQASNSHRRFAEVADLLRALQDDPGDGDQRDEWIAEHFERWTPKEHRAFRDQGIWPESQGPAPDFIVNKQEESTHEG